MISFWLGMTACWTHSFAPIQLILFNGILRRSKVFDKNCKKIEKVMGFRLKDSFLETKTSQLRSLQISGAILSSRKLEKLERILCLVLNWKFLMIVQSREMLNCLRFCISVSPQIQEHGERIFYANSFKMEFPIEELKAYILILLHENLIEVKI